MTTKNPWLGLASYEEPKNDGNDYLFCGRDEETLDVVRLIDNNLFITLYGSSGIGKTSLLRAGVIPILRRKGYFPLYVRLSQEPDDISYAEAIVRKLQSCCLTEERCTEMKHGDGNDRLFLWNYFAITRFLKDGREVYPVIILDQFEEVFRDGDKAKAELLLKQIYLLLNDELEIPNEEGYSADTNYRFVASIREDFLFVLEDSIDELSMDLYKNNRYRLRPMKPANARQVVLVLGKDCVEESEKEEIAERVIELATNSKKHYIDTLLLSLVCSITFEKQSDSKLSLSDYDFWGDNPMRVYYQEAIKSLSVGQVRYIQNHLINKNGSRSKVQQKELEKELGKETYLSLMEGTYRIFTLTSDEYVELLHDQLALTIFEDRDAYEERERSWKLMKLQSRLVTEKAKNLDSKDRSLALRLLLEVLPKDVNHPDKPLVSETELAFRNALCHSVPLFLGNIKIDDVVISPNDNCVVTVSDEQIAIWDIETSDVKCIPVETNNDSRRRFWRRTAIFSPDGSRIVSLKKDDDIVHIWDTKTGKELNTLKGNTVALSPDGTLCVSVSSDNSGCIWNVGTGKVLHVLEDRDDTMEYAAFSQSGRSVVSLSKEHYVRIWNTGTGKLIRKLDGKYLTKTPDFSRMVTLAEDNLIRIWDVETGKELHVLEEHSSVVKEAVFSPDGNRMVTIAEDNTVRVWDVETGKELHAIKGLDSRVCRVTFSPDGRRVAVSSYDDGTSVLDAETGKLIKKVKVNNVVFGPDGRRVAVFSYDDGASVLDAETGKLIKKVKGNNVVFSSDGRRVAVSSFDDTCVLDTEMGKLIKKIKRGKVVFGPDGKHVFTITSSLRSDTSTLCIMDSITGDVIKKIEEQNTGEVEYVDFSPDGERVVAALEDKTIRILNAKPSADNIILKGHTDVVMSAAFSPDGRRIVSASADNAVRIWNAKTGKMLKVLSGHNGIVRSAYFSPDGKRIVSASFDGTIRVWNAKTGKEIIKIEGHTDKVGDASFSPNGKQIVSASADKTIRVWDVRTGKEIKKLEGHNRAVNSVVFNHDGSQVLSASQDGIVYLWDVESGAAINKMEGSFAAFSPDERYIVTTNDRGMLCIWNVEKESCITTIKNQRFAFSAFFSPDGKHIVTASRGGNIRIWDFPPLQELIDQTRERYKDCPLMDEERRRYYLE